MDPVAAVAGGLVGVGGENFEAAMVDEAERAGQKAITGARIKISRAFLQSANWPDAASHLKIDVFQWQQLLDLQSQLAEYLRKIGEPEAH